MNRRTCHFSGHVQGVGFRYTAQGIAEHYNVSGYVRNMSDGRVELVVEGADDEMDRFLGAVRERMDEFVRKVDTQMSPGTGQFKDFSIRY